MWAVLVDWPFLGVFVPLLIGIGVGVMGLTPPEYLLAKACFTVSALIVLAKVGSWLIAADSPTLHRIFLCFFLFGAVGVAWLESWRWVTVREGPMMASRHAAAPESRETPPVTPQARPAPVSKVELKPPAISWMFEKESKSKPYGFLGMTRTGKEEARILEIHVAGRNDSGVHINRFSGFIISEVTDQRVHLLLNIDGKLFPPEKSKGIPPGARFDITSPRFPTDGPREGVPASKFIKEFGGFLFVFEYDGERYERRFTAEDIERSARRMEYESM